MSLRNRELVFLIPALSPHHTGVRPGLHREVLRSQLVVAHLWGPLPGSVRHRSPRAGGCWLPRPIRTCCRSRPCCPPWVSSSSTGSTRTLALKQAMWLVVGLVAFLLVLALVRDLEVTRAGTATRSASSVFCSCFSPPSSAGRSTEPGSGWPSGRSLPAGGIRQDPARHLLCRLSGGHPGGAHREHPPGPGRALAALPLPGAPC